MPYIKLTKASLAHLTGQLPGKNFRGVSFADGVSVDNLDLAIADKFAAQLEGVMLCNAAGVVEGPAGERYRKTITVPTPAVPRAASEYPAAPIPVIKTITDNEEYVLTAADNGLLLNVDGGQITVRSDLPAAFQVTIRASSGTVNVLPENDAVINATVAGAYFRTETQFAIVGLMRFPDGTFQITGQFEPVNP